MTELTDTMKRKVHLMIQRGQTCNQIYQATGVDKHELKSIVEETYQKPRGKNV